MLLRAAGDVVAPMPRSADGRAAQLIGGSADKLLADRVGGREQAPADHDAHHKPVWLASPPSRIPTQLFFLIAELCLVVTEPWTSAFRLSGQLQLA